MLKLYLDGEYTLDVDSVHCGINYLKGLNIGLGGVIIKDGDEILWSAKS